MDFLINWIAATPGYAAPLLLASLGLIINEKAGVLNLGAEGMMACGALAGAAFSLISGWPLLGLVASITAGALMAALFGAVTIYLRANQVVTGLVVVALGAGVTGVLGRDFVSQTVPGFKALDFGFLSEVAVIGPILFSQNALTYLAFLMVPVVWYGLSRTMAGLRLRAVGEDPSTADACGVHVLTTRFLAVLAGGALCGAAGGYLSLASSYIWVEGMVAGRGWRPLTKREVT